MDIKPLIKISGASFRKFQHPVFSDTDWEMLRGENWAVTGANNSGKTTFIEAIEGRLMRTKGTIEYYFDDNPARPTPDSYNHIGSVCFSDRMVDYGSFYYQQRYHASEVEGIVTVRNFLKLADTPLMPEIRDLGLDPLLDMEIIKLSNGQFKKMLIIKALMKKPRLLLLDNLYTGLDKQARVYISDTIENIIDQGTNIVMAADRRYIPKALNSIMEVEGFSIKTISRNRSNESIEDIQKRDFPVVPALPENKDNSFETAVDMRGVHVAYGGKTVLDNVDWTVKRGEKWALMGPNGAGKSMLLSLIFADNPQAYANDLILFDRKRGTGENIWQIKDRIGFVSPEMHLYFNRNDACREVVLSGLAENPYHKKQLTTEFERFMDGLFAYFSIEKLKDEPFQRVSTGRQNILLLMRALLRNPAVLILDEPFQGMDGETTHLARRLIDSYCADRTLIIVSHNQRELPSITDRYLYMENGRVA